jgi:hypothetical protein
MDIQFLIPPVQASECLWLLQFDRRKLGVHKVAGWCMQLDGRTVSIDSEEKCVPLIPVLELEEAKFVEFLREMEKAYPEFAARIHEFPKGLLLKHVFHTSVSGYWPEKALTWLVNDRALQSSFTKELEVFSTNRVMPQRARQIANKLVRDLQRLPGKR